MSEPLQAEQQFVRGNIVSVGSLVLQTECLYQPFAATSNHQQGRDDSAVVAETAHESSPITDYRKQFIAANIELLRVACTYRGVVSYGHRDMLVERLCDLDTHSNKREHMWQCI